MPAWHRSGEEVQHGIREKVFPCFPGPPLALPRPGGYRTTKDAFPANSGADLPAYGHRYHGLVRRENPLSSPSSKSCLAVVPELKYGNSPTTTDDGRLYHAGPGGAESH